MHPRLECLETRLAPAATQLVVTTEPPTAVAAGATFSFEVSAEDASGDVDTTFDGDVSVVGAGVSGGPTTVAAVDGVASFNGMEITTAGTETLVAEATAGGLTPALTDSIAVTAATATQVEVISPPPATVVAGSDFGLVLAAADPYGNVDSSFSGTVTLALANNPGGSTLSGTTLVTFSNGLASFTGLSLNAAGSDYTLVADSKGLAPAPPLDMSVTAGTATQLLVVSPPPETVAAGTGFGVVFEAADPYGNLSPSYSGNVTLALAGNPGGGTLDGTTNVSFSNGLATFSGLTLDQADSGYTLRASSSGLTSPGALSIAVTPAAATQLVVTTQPPATVDAGGDFGLAVAVEDAYGNRATGFTGNLAVAPAGGLAAGSLGGVLTVAATDGLAEFNDLTLDQAGSADTLQVTGTGLTAATTSPFSVIGGVATQLVVTTPPPTTVTAGSTFGLVLAAADPYGNVDSAYSGTVTVGLATNPGDGTLDGVTTASFTDGLATFAGLTLDQAGSDYTLEVSSSGLASPGSTGSLTFSVTAATSGTSSSATPQLEVISPPPSTVTAGSDFGLVLAAADQYGNVDTAFDGSVTLALATDPGGGTLGGVTNVNFSNGLATFSGLTLDQAGAGYSLQASSSGLEPLGSTSSLTFSVAAAAPSQLVVTTPPPAIVTAGQGFGLTVAVEDAYGNRATGFTGNLAVAPAGGLAAGSLGGVLTVAATDGLAEFNDLTLDQAGSGDTLQVTGTGLTAATTSPFSVTAGLATQLVVTTSPPATVTAGSDFGLVLAAADPYGNVDTSFSGSVTLALATNPGDATLGGVTTVDFSDGLASFTGLTIDAAGAGYTLRASSSGLASPSSASSLTFSVTAASSDTTSVAATQLVVISPPPAVVVAGASFGFVIAAADPSGDVDTAFGGSVTLALADNPGGGTLGGVTNVNFSNGLATFSGLTLDQAGTGYTLQVSSSGLAPPSSLASLTFNVDAASATQLVVTTPPPATVAVGQDFSVTVAVEDAYGNRATGFTGNLAVAPAGSLAAGSLNGILTVAVDHGLATFSGLSLDQPGSDLTLEVSGPGLPDVVTSPFSITAAQATQLVVTTAPPSDVTVDSGFGLQVAAEDAFGNLDTTFDGSVTIALASNPGAASLGGTLTVTATDGVATFSGLTIDTAGPGYTLQATSAGEASATTGLIDALTPGTTAPASGTSSSGPAPHLAVDGQPSVVDVGADFQLTILVENSLGATESDYTGTVSLTLAGDPGGASLGGSLTMPLTYGVATFYDLSLSAPGSGYTIRASSSDYTSVLTAPITVVDPAIKLAVIAAPPSSVDANATFGLTIAVEDASGNVVTGYNGTVTLSLVGKHGATTLHGQLTATATNGVVSFSGLTLPRARKSYVLQVQATASGLAGVTTHRFEILPAAAKPASRRRR